jgi:hypothetical protein
MRLESSAHVQLRGVNEGNMKKPVSKRQGTKPTDADEILPEYDFSGASPNKYASRYAAGSVVVVLDPDVATAFPTSGEANEALRALAGIIQKRRARRL